MEKNQKIMTALVLFVVISTVLFSIVMMLLIKENSECTTNPFVYSAKKLVEQGYDPVLCSCSTPNPLYGSFSYDNESVWVNQVLDPRERVNSQFNFNLSDYVIN